MIQTFTNTAQICIFVTRDVLCYIHEMVLLAELETSTEFSFKLQIL